MTLSGGSPPDDRDRRTRAEAALLSGEPSYQLIVDTIPALIASMTPGGEVEHVNRQVYDYFGRTLDELKRWGTSDAVHPDDLPRVLVAWKHSLTTGLPYEIEHRMRGADGVYRWFQVRGVPLRDDEDRIVRWYVVMSDIEARKESEARLQSSLEEIRRLKDRLQDENLALREEIDQASMFEEIVGNSRPLRSVLSNLTKVAPTDSTVLITGETGTGKELIARAIHKRSRRSAGSFVSVNCAAIPPSLIASELFGHEKGAFTGALQRRVGRFELAEGGTIFLDEVGELPAETQMALLRVLQEREFERVGGSRPIRADVRVISATNRDLNATIAAGTFRADLFYRLNVFPLAVPPLRERRDDIPVLVRYFVERYSRNVGKKITGISKASLDLLSSYTWPGNIRELQNVVERAVILCETATLTVDERWLTGAPGLTALPRPMSERLSLEERAMIEAALAETRGTVSGPFGAAAKLKMPSTTLESKIRALGIDKRRFKILY